MLFRSSVFFIMFTVLACGFYIPSLKNTDDRVMNRDIHLFYVTLIGEDKANYRYSSICSFRTENQLFFYHALNFRNFLHKKIDSMGYHGCYIQQLPCHLLNASANFFH